MTDDYAGVKGRFYRGYIRRPALARMVGAVLWGSDFRPLYRTLRHLETLPPGTVVVDAACGAGLALEWLDPLRGHRYTGVDRSAAMLAQARAVARARGFGDVRLHQGDITALPLDDGSAGAGLCFNALHCVGDPEAAVADLVRCLAPGGVVAGSSLVRGGSSRADRLLRLDPTMGPGGTADDLERWLTDAGLSDIHLEVSGAMVTFRAHRW